MEQEHQLPHSSSSASSSSSANLHYPSKIFLVVCFFVFLLWPTNLFDRRQMFGKFTIFVVFFFFAIQGVTIFNIHQKKTPQSFTKIRFRWTKPMQFIWLSLSLARLNSGTHPVKSVRFLFSSSSVIVTFRVCKQIFLFVRVFFFSFSFKIQNKRFCRRKKWRL